MASTTGAHIILSAKGHRQSEKNAWALYVNREMLVLITSSWSDKTDELTIIPDASILNFRWMRKGMDADNPMGIP